MEFERAVKRCHVRSAIYRTANPDRKFWKNHDVPLKVRVPKEDQMKNDWEEHDPRDDDGGSLFMFND